MNWTFKQCTKHVDYNIVDSAVAVRPVEELRQREGPLGAGRFGPPATPDFQGERSYLARPSENRQAFEDAGWIFVEPEGEVARAAVDRSAIADADAVRQVVTGRYGELMIATNRVTVQLPEDMSKYEALQRLEDDKLEFVRHLGFASNLFEARLAVGRPLVDAIGELQALAHYEFIHPVLLQEIAERQQTTDPDFPQQWHHNNIQSKEAWELTEGVGPQRPVRLALIDGGMQITHADLKEGIKGGGFFDDDKDGTFHGLQPDLAGFPDKPHGTFCMAMAGARRNNGSGGCGSAPQADLTAIACIHFRVGTQATLARAIGFAANPTTEHPQATAADGVDVISCSLGSRGVGWDMAPELDKAITVAATKGRGGLGVPIFWAVHNDPFDIALDEVCSHERVIAVGRSNRDDRHNGSAFGSKLELLAPGVDVFGARLTSSGPLLRTGTSFATPLAAGVAALVLSRHPKWTADQVRQRMRESCDQVGGVEYVNGHHDDYGFGRINASKAVQ